MIRLAGATVIGLTLVAAAWAFLSWLSRPGPVPDHATVFSATQVMTLAGPSSLGQRILPSHDRLSAVDFILGTEAPDLPGNVEITLVDAATLQPLRQARVPAASLPRRAAWELRPGQPGEQWTAFGFEPLEDSAGRALVVRLSYPDGVDRPGVRVHTLAHFPGTYSRPSPVLEVNGFPQSGNLLFRLTWAGTRGDAFSVALDNVARGQPGNPGSLVFPVGLFVASALMAAGFTFTLWRTGGSAGGSRSKHTSNLAGSGRSPA